MPAVVKPATVAEPILTLNIAAMNHAKNKGCKDKFVNGFISSMLMPVSNNICFKAPAPAIMSRMLDTSFTESPMGPIIFLMLLPCAIPNVYNEIKKEISIATEGSPIICIIWVAVFFSVTVKLIIVSKPINKTGKKAAIKLAPILGDPSSETAALEKIAKGLVVYFFRVTEKIGPAIIITGIAIIIP